MIQSEILKEKDRIQARLSGESASIHEYLERSHFAAKEVAESYGFFLQYAEMPTNGSSDPLHEYFGNASHVGAAKNATTTKSFHILKT